MFTNLRCFCLLLLMLFAGFPLDLLAQNTRRANAPAPTRIVSPEIAADRSVTFRLRAPEARSVRLTSGGDLPQIPARQMLELQQAKDGIWQLRIGPVDPGAYRYAFVVDGVNVLDPANPEVSRSNDSSWSLFTVPGSSFMDARATPSGAIAEITYQSAELGRLRRMHVYTPPGYGLTVRRYPVLYLLHGAMDSDDSWHTVGRAGVILDNLIADKHAEPMIVVMPAGHDGPFAMGGAGGLPLEGFAREFKRDIRPYIEANYLVRTDRGSTAIAGLSMGGAQALEIAFLNLGDFGYVGVFSSGVFSIAQDSEWETNHAAQLDDVSLKQGLRLLWFATGKDDFLLDTTKATVALLQRHGFGVTYRESAGGHTWINWREYLNEFAPLLFKSGN